MAVFGFSRPDCDVVVVAFTEPSPDAREDALPVVVVLLGGRPASSGRRPPENPRRTLIGTPWTSAWSNGRDEVRYSRTTGLVAVGKREYAQCADGKTLVVLANARRPEEPAACIAIAELPAPSTERHSIASLVWRMLRSRVVHRRPYQWPLEQWIDRLTELPAVRTFLSGAPSLN